MASLWRVCNIAVGGAQIYAALYWTMPRDRLIEEEEEDDEVRPSLETAPSSLELLRSAAPSSMGLTDGRVSVGCPPAPSSGKGCGFPCAC